MTGCGSSGESLSPPPTIETGEDGGGLAADVGAESSTPTPLGVVDSGSEDGGTTGTTAAESGATQSSPGEAGTGEGTGDGSIDTGLVGDDAGSACANGKALLPSDAPGVMASTGYAAVKWIVASSTELVGLQDDDDRPGEACRHVRDALRMARSSAVLELEELPADSATASFSPSSPWARRARRVPRTTT